MTRLLLALVILALAILACGGEIDQAREDPQGFCDAWCGANANLDCQEACLRMIVK